VNTFTIIYSDEEMTKIKVVDVDEFYNFIVNDFFIWNDLLLQNVDSSCHFLNLNFELIKQSHMKKMTKIIVVTTQ